MKLKKCSKVTRQTFKRTNWTLIVEDKQSAAQSCSKVTLGGRQCSKLSSLSGDSPVNSIAKVKRSPLNGDRYKSNSLCSPLLAPPASDINNPPALGPSSPGRAINSSGQRGRRRVRRASRRERGREREVKPASERRGIANQFARIVPGN